jgi:pathogenesis-related protein 1
VRAAVTGTTPLPPLTWSDTLAAYAQDWADTQASTSCSNPGHRSQQVLNDANRGENLAVFWYQNTAPSTIEDAVQDWAAEKACWTYGTFMGTDQCEYSCYKDYSDGCGHYTQIVWRDTTQVGCGVATCVDQTRGGSNVDIWICNYSPAGNVVSERPY